MPNETKCGTCNGCGKVDNKEGKAWADITTRRNPRVSSGELTPVHCPSCRGTGAVRNEGEPRPDAVAAPDMRAIAPPAAPQSPAAPIIARVASAPVAGDVGGRKGVK